MTDPRAGTPSVAASVAATLVRRLVDRVAAALRAQSSGDPFCRDPELVRRLLPLFETVNHYFGTEIRGWDNLPAHGPFLVVGNHSGGLETN